MDQPVQQKITDFFKGYETREHPKGTILTFQHEEPAGISHLLGGTVEQYDITPAGNKVVVNVYKPPAFFPMSWAINKTPNAYFFAAASDVVLQLADADETVAFLKSNPDVLYDLLSRVYKGTDALLRKQVVAAGGVASNRLVWELLIEGYRFGVERPSGQTVITVQQNVLASRCGLARETVNRELHKLEKMNLLSFVPTGLQIDLSGLERRLSHVT